MSTYSLRRVMKEMAKKEVEQSKEEVFVCEHCGKEYKTEKGLKAHIEQKHKDGE